MNKPIAIRLEDQDGNVYRWTIRYFTHGYWSYTDHEGYMRLAEGNWLDLVARFKGTAENYGFRLLSELN